MTDNNLQASIEDLQERISYQDDTIQKLNDVIALQDDEVRRLNEMMRIINGKMNNILQLGDDSDSSVTTNEKPPHY